MRLNSIIKISYIFVIMLVLNLVIIFPVFAEEEIGVANDYSNLNAESYEMDIKKEISKALTERDSLKEQLLIKKEELSKLETNKEKLDLEISRVEKVSKLTSDKIKDVSSEIINLKGQLEVLYAEIISLEKELELKEDEFRKRINSSSKSSFSNYFEVLLNSKNFSDMINKLNSIKKIVNMDNKIIEEYLELSDKLSSKKKEQEFLLIDLEDNVKELELIRKSLEEENRLNKIEVSGLSSSYLSQLEDYKTLSFRFNEVNILAEELEKQYKLLTEFSKYIKTKVGDYGLHPLLEYKRKELIKLSSEKGIYLITTAGLRTFEEQNKLYNQGRDSSGIVVGSVVTNAKGGQSWHNYGLAFDVAFDNGYGVPTWEEYDMNKNGIDDWDEIGLIGESIGLEWGGRWIVLLDRPHFQYTFNKSMSEINKAYISK